MDLGSQPPANALLSDQQLHLPEKRHPLRLALCRHCWLLQITDILPPSDLFEDYPYFSSVSDALVRHSAEAVNRHRERMKLGSDSLVIEIASNDGYLLQHFQKAGIPCLGIEPAANVAAVARDRGIDTRVEFFNLENARRLASERGQADLILANNVFAHVPTPNDFVAGLAALVKPDGRIVLEFPEAVPFIENTEFDTIYHEHVFYFSLTAVQPLFLRHGLEVIDAEPIAIHGGSLRLSVAPIGSQPIDARVRSQQERERRLGVNTAEFYEDFTHRAQEVRVGLLETCRKLTAAGKRIAAYGASAKGSTLLNFCGIGRNGIDCIEFVVDRSPAKQGRHTPGSHLPILPPETLLERRPDFAVLLTWNFAEEILSQQQAYCNQGGRFIVPLPQVHILPEAPTVDEPFSR